LSIFADIESLEEKVQKILAEAGSYSSVDDFVRTYTNTIIDSLGDFSALDLNLLDETGLDTIVEKAIRENADLINVDLIEDIQRSVNEVIDNSVAFYREQGIDFPKLKEAVNRTDAAQEITDLFTTNMAEMRSELLDGTIDVLKDELAQGFFNRSDLEELIFQYADGKAHYARTNARMVVSSYNRIGREQVRDSANLQHGFYYGDARVNTRPFCLRCIGKVFTLQDIEQMDNGQLSPVKIYAGGWNCIHSWLWVDPEWDEELKDKINTDPVVPVEEGSLKIKAPSN